MGRMRWKQAITLLVCAVFSFLWAYQVPRKESQHGIRAIDFGEIYYGSRCVRQHKDPYDPGTVLQQFKDDGGKFPTDPLGAKVVPIVITIGVNLPTTLFLAAPVAMLPWAAAETLWVVLIILLLALAAVLICDLGNERSAPMAGILAGLILANCQQVLFVGNLAGIAVPLCIIAGWCFLRQRYEWAGVVLLALSLVLKPHDSGFVWLYFLMVGGTQRKCALQTLGVVTVVAILAAAWIAPSSPHWVQELHRNHVLVSGTGSTSDPGLTGISSRTIAPIIDLQAALSIFNNTPTFYERGAYLLGGLLILAWILHALRSRATAERNLLALAAIGTLTLLPIYHRPYDAKLLLLTIPACALLWAEKGLRRWLAAGLTLMSILLTCDIPLALWTANTKGIVVSTASLSGKMATLLLFRPIPLVLLATGCFYLWTYIAYPASAAEVVESADRSEDAQETLPAPAHATESYV